MSKSITVAALTHDLMRKRSLVTLIWDDDPEKNALKQKEFGEKRVHDWKIQSLENCSACHR